MTMNIERTSNTPAERAKINRTRPSIRQIQECVCDEFGINIDDMLLARRNKEVVQARAVAMFLSKRLTSASFPQISTKFERSDHTTALYAVRKIEKQIKTNHEIREIVERLGADIAIQCNRATWEDRMNISDASQLAALQTAVDLAYGRIKLNAAQRELFCRHIEAIRLRVIAAAAKRPTRELEKAE